MDSGSPAKQESMRPSPFNVHATFQPKPQVLAPGGPTSFEAFERRPVPQQSSTFPQGEIPNNCPCMSRFVQVLNIAPGQDANVMDLIYRFGETDSKPLYSPGDRIMTVHYFDNRSAGSLENYFSFRALPMHAHMRARRLPRDDLDTVALNNPWSVSIMSREMGECMAGNGEIAFSKIETAPNGNVTFAQFLFHDYRDALKVTTIAFPSCGGHFTFRPAKFPHSAVCQMRTQIQATAPIAQIQPIGPPRTDPSSSMRAPNICQSQLFLPAPFGRSPFMQHRPYSVSPFQSHYNRNSLNNQESGSMRLPVSSRIEQLDSFNGSVSSEGSNPNSPYIAPIGTGSTFDSQNSGGETSTYGTALVVQRPRALGGSFSSIESGNSASPTTPSDDLEFSEHESCLDALKKFNTGSSSQERDSPEKNEMAAYLPSSVPQLRSPSELGAVSFRPQVVCPQKRDSTSIDLNAIDAGRETRTTVMVRNIPNKLEFADFKRFVDSTNKGTYEFLYLRFDFCNRCNVGYAFISFASPEDVKTFVKRRTGMKWSQYNYNSEKIIEIRYARIQGCENLINKFRNSPVMEQESKFRPKLYHTSGVHLGKEKPFPPYVPMIASS